MTVWNTIDDRYSSCVFYIVTYTDSCRFRAFSVWKCRTFCLLYRYEAKFTDFARFHGTLSMRVWNTIDDKESILSRSTYRLMLDFTQFCS